MIVKMPRGRRWHMDEYRKIVTDTYKSKRGDGDPVRRNQTAV